MKQKTIFQIFFVAVAFSIVSCKKDATTQPPPQSPPPQPAQQARQAQAKPKPIIVKGFYIGMPMEDAIKKARELFGEGYSSVYSPDGEVLRRAIEILGENSGSGDGLDNTMTCYVVHEVAEGRAHFKFDRDNKRLTIMFFGSAAVNYLFNASELNPEEFAKQFANAYGIPEMESRQKGKFLEWRYVNSDAVYVEIYQDDKTLNIYQGDIQKTQGNFN